MTKIFSAILMATLLLAPGAAIAQNFDKNFDKAKAYFGARFGVSVPDQPHFRFRENNSTDFSLLGRSSINAGPNVSLFYGYDLGDYRVDLEFGSMANKLSSFTFVRDGGLGATAGQAPLVGPQTPTTGSLRAQTFFLNAYRDLKLDGPITPYVGIGGGLARVDYKGIDAGGFPLFDNADIRFGYQLTAGATVWRQRRMSLSLDYRYTGTRR